MRSNLVRVVVLFLLMNVSVGVSPTVYGNALSVPTLSDSTMEQGDKVNINTASQEQLLQIKGVGPVLAERVVLYREKNGPFKQIEDLRSVAGIGEVKFNQIKSRVIVK